MNVVNYIGNDSQYEDEDGNHFYHNEVTEEDYLKYVGESWKSWKENDPDWVEDRVMGNKICRLYLSTTEFPPLEPPKMIGDECKLSRRVAPSDPLNLLADSEFPPLEPPKMIGDECKSEQTRNQYPQPIPWEYQYLGLSTKRTKYYPCEYRYENRDLLAELGLGTEQYYYDLIQAADCDIPRHKESTKKKEEKREAKRKHDRNMAMLSRVAKYITTKSKECGSPLVSRVYDKNKYIFQCQHCHKTDRECFTFKVEFDRHGFYIPLLNKETDEIALGGAWHDCECPIPEDIKKRLVYNSDGIIESSSSESSIR